MERAEGFENSLELFPDSYSLKTIQPQLSGGTVLNGTGFCSVCCVESFVAIIKLTGKSKMVVCLRILKLNIILK